MIGTIEPLSIFALLPCLQIASLFRPRLTSKKGNEATRIYTFLPGGTARVLRGIFEAPLRLNP